MFLLQSALSVISVLLVFLCIMLVIVTPLLTGIFMRAYWKLADKTHNIIENKPYYKEPLPFLFSIILSVSLIIGFFLLLILLLDKIDPGWNYFN